MIFKVSSVVHTIENNTFKHNYDSPIYEWCSFVKGKGKVGKYDWFSLKLMQVFTPQLTKGCPMVGKFEIVNAKIGRQYFAFLGVQTYRFNVTMQNAAGNKLTCVVYLKVYEE